MDQLNIVPHQGHASADEKQVDTEIGLSSSDRKDSFKDGDEKLADKGALEDVSDLPIDSKYVTKFNDKGEPIIETGHDVSRYLVSVRDDGDEPMTFRGLVMGTALGVLNILIGTLFTVKPTSAGFSVIFNMLILYVSAEEWCGKIAKADG